MGFCLLNSVAIGALYALHTGTAERVAILDFDVHHGNGTVDIFKDRPEVLVCSSFQHPFYPNRLHDCVRPNIVHSPLAAGSDGSVYKQTITRDWPGALHNHQPDMIFVSAGFDAHTLDPLANLNLTTEDFRWITEQICDWADTYAQGRIVSALEGGYDLDALAQSVMAHLDALSQ